MNALAVHRYLLAQGQGYVPLVAEADIRFQDIWLAMGYHGTQPPEDMARYVRDLLAEILPRMHARYEFRVYPVVVSPDSTFFSPGPVITPILAEAPMVALFTASVGEEFQSWLDEAGRSGDIMRHFAADCIGSELAECAARYTASLLQDVCEAQGWHIGNSYSPGYCGWPVTDQRQLFALMSPMTSGITLKDSCLMSPVKSISGLIPVGPEVLRRHYSCALCPRTDCYKKQKL